jgi:vacuolar-type H+-ATPase subunit E/Vma4
LGLEELISTLRKNERQQIKDIWQSAESEAESLRKKIAEATAEITRNHSDQLNSACQRSRRSIFSEADIKTREKKLLTYRSLDQALKDAALKQLPGLRQQDYEDVFARLVAELPERQWEKIFVNPTDRILAAKFFPEDIISQDPSISAGLIATTAGNKIIVNNTFEKRLEKKWFQLLPAIIAQIEKKYGESGSA